MNILQLFVATSATLFILGGGVASAGEPKKDTGAMACVNDKWDVKEPEKGHKLVDAAMRCVLIPDDAANRRSARTAQETTNICLTAVGRVPEPARTIIRRKDVLDMGEGSHLKEYTYTKTSGTGKYQGVKGGGTYMYAESFRHALRWPI